MINLLLLLQFLTLPIPIPKPEYDVVQIKELITHRSYDLGNPMPELEVTQLAISAMEEKSDTISIPLILAIIEFESRYDRKGKSKKNCKGLMQLSFGTAKTMAQRLKLNKFDVFHIGTNIKLGVGYLKALLEEQGSILKALTIYNRGWKVFVNHDKKISGYALGVVKRSKDIEKSINNNLSCKK
jgi:hypothetical protein